MLSPTVALLKETRRLGSHLSKAAILVAAKVLIELDRHQPSHRQIIGIHRVRSDVAEPRGEWIGPDHQRVPFAGFGVGAAPVARSGDDLVASRAKEADHRV